LLIISLVSNLTLQVESQQTENKELKIGNKWWKEHEFENQNAIDYIIGICCNGISISN
jgi:hypothetical protein